MKKVILALFGVIAFAVISFAATANGPDAIEMKRNVTFNHKAHIESLKDCTKCHTDAKGGKIEGFGKEVAHKTCKVCHVEMKKPAACTDCHKKK